MGYILYEPEIEFKLGGNYMISGSITICNYSRLQCSYDGSSTEIQRLNRSSDCGQSSNDLNRDNIKRQRSKNAVLASNYGQDLVGLTKGIEFNKDQ